MLAVAASGTVRARVRAAIVATVALALLLLGGPLAAAVALLYRDAAESRLEGEASRVLVAVPDDNLGRPGAALPLPLDPETALGLYDGRGHLLSGRGPTDDASVARAAQLNGALRRISNGQVVVLLPFRTDNGDRVVVRAARTDDDVVEHTVATWAAMVVLAALVLGVAWLVGSRRAAALAEPFERLTADAQALGRGNFAVRGHVTGLVEADAAGAALEDTARRLGALIERERAFSSDASHQLRTPLTRLRLGIESTLLDPTADRDTALRAALVRLDGLESTVTSLLALARDTGSPRDRCDLAVAVNAAWERWHDVVAEAGRDLLMRREVALAQALCSQAALSQVVDVLVDNALQHGAGQIVLATRRAGPGLALDVTDEGPGLGPDPERAFSRRSAHAAGTGIGLALARSLAEAEGGRLVVGGPGAVLTVLLPSAEVDA